MIVTAISDLHGQIDTLENIIPESDILCICGDIIPLNIQNNISKSDKWFSNMFIPKLQSLKVNEIYIIAGNHDKFMENRKRIIEDMLIGTNITYLEDEAAEYLDEETGKVWKIWGTPWCHIFGNWSFMREPEFLKEKYSLIPDDIDILLTHEEIAKNLGTSREVISRNLKILEKENFLKINRKKIIILDRGDIL